MPQGTTDLRGCDDRGNQIGFGDIRLDMVLQSSQGPIEIPGKGQPAVLVFLEALKFLDQEQLEFHGNPGGKFKRNVLVGEGAAVTAWFRDDSHRAGLFYPLPGRHGKTVQAGALSKPVEFDGFEPRIIQALPNAQEVDGVAVAQPVADQIIRQPGIFVAGNVRQR